MNDSLSRALAERVAAATPTILPSFVDVRRRARRRRVRHSLMIVGATVLFAGVFIGTWWLFTPSQNSGSLTTPSTTRSTQYTSPPTPDISPYPSGIVLRLHDQEVELPAETSCWISARPEDCQTGLLPPTAQIPDVGRRDIIEFNFARPGWRFHADFRRAGNNCSRVTQIAATQTGDTTFLLRSADHPGQYEVELIGEGPDGSFASGRFLWTTTEDGPVDAPLGSLTLTRNPRGEDSFGVVVSFRNLGFQPSESEVSPTAIVTLTGADGTERTVYARLNLPTVDCTQAGSQATFQYQGEWYEPLTALGGSPIDAQILMRIRDETYVGRAAWRNSGGSSSYTPVVFTPPLSEVERD
jgi:hypothetical protein